jgi:predicted O-methyltransferase YrrM
MRSPSPALIADLVRHCSNGPLDPHTQIGCQRELPDDLGFGWLYFALARACEVRRALVIGSGRGFAPACFALGMEHRPGAEVVLVDPGYEAWTVDGVARDVAAGFWRTPEQTTRHFADTLNLRNVRWLPKRSDDAFREFCAAGDRFDLILIDGDHGYQQCLSDLRQATACVQSGGLILAHDAFCHHWPGVAFAIDTLALEDRTLQRICVPLYPGLALLQKSQALITLQRLTAAENEQVNLWRSEQGVSLRPLSSGDDPRPEEATTDSRVGLFGIYEEGRLIGGLGLRRRVFQGTGPDDFVPDCGQPLEGFLLYGLVICPEKQGKGYWRLVRRQLLHWFADEGYYLLSRHKDWDDQEICSVQRVGEAGWYTAYHFRARQTGPTAPAAGAMPLASRLEAQVRRLHLQPAQAQLQEACHRHQQEVSQLQQEANRVQEQLQQEARQHQQEADRLQEQLREVSRALQQLLHSTSWRWTRPARVVGRWLRSLWAMLKRSRHRCRAGGWNGFTN